MSIGVRELGDDGRPTATEDWEQSIGDAVRTLRLRAGLSQAQLAERADVSIGSVKGLEQGKGSTLRTVIRLVRALDREDWLEALAPRVTVSPLDLLRSRTEPRQRVRHTRRRD
jgi:transcriptional regulator with XRE-family HTH domain